MNRRRMTRNDRRAHNKRAAQFSTTFQRIPESEWPDLPGFNRVSVWRNRDFLVQVFAEKGFVFRVSINRTRIKSAGEWDDNITWDEMQSIKSAIGFADFDAVEVFPRQRDEVNVANMRHLWVLPTPLAFAWRRPERNDG